LGGALRSASAFAGAGWQLPLVPQPHYPEQALPGVRFCRPTRCVGHGRASGIRIPRLRLRPHAGALATQWRPFPCCGYRRDKPFERPRTNAAGYCGGGGGVGSAQGFELPDAAVVPAGLAPCCGVPGGGAPVVTCAPVSGAVVVPVVENVAGCSCVWLSGSGGGASAPY